MSRRPASVFAFVAFTASLLIAGIHGLASAAEPLPGASAAFVSPAEPLVVEGALPNGLRYLVLPHNSPKNDLSIRLIVQAGSLDERDDERGYAHFVEHMAFRGTRVHPEGHIRQSFEKLGLLFGADLNARTHQTHTVYLMDLPEGRAGGLGEALDLLREFADGINFSPDHVERERGVVLSEWRARDNPAQRIAVQMQTALYAGTRIAERDVIGLPTQIQQATAEKLRAYYQRNYAPNRMVVVVVGPVEATTVVERIVRSFGSMITTNEAAPPAAVPTPPPPTGISPHVVIVPNSPGVIVEFVRIRRRPADDEAGRRQEILQQIAQHALSARLRSSQDAMSPPLGATRAEESAGACPVLVHDTVGSSALKARWADAVTFLETELRRIRLQGFTPSEIDEAAALTLASQRAAVSQFSAAPAARIADAIGQAVEAERRWRPPGVELAESKAIVSGLTAKALSDTVSDTFPAASFHLVFRTSSPMEGGTDVLLAAVANSAARPLVAPQANAAELTFAYRTFGPPGALATRSSEEDLGIERLTFTNGVHVNLRPSKLEPEQFRLRVTFAQNASNVPKNRPGLAELAGMVYIGAHLGRHVDTEISRLLALHGVSRQLEVARGVLSLTFSGQSSELPFTLGLVTAFASDLFLDRVAYPVALSRYDHFYTTQLNELPQQAVREAMYRAAGRDARLRLVPATHMASYKFEEVRHWIETYWVNGPIEIGIVGDFESDQTVAIAAKTVGTLAPRVNPPPAKPLTTIRRSTRDDLVATTLAGSASVCVLWPLPPTSEPHADAAMMLAVRVLGDRLRVTLRDELGATYTPGTGTRRDPRQLDFGFAWMLTTFAPARATELTDRSLAIARRLAKDGVTEEEFLRLREPMRARRMGDLRNNEWWLDTVVSAAQMRPETLAAARAHVTALDAITRADVNAAARIFASPTSVTIVRPAATPDRAP